MSDGGLVTITSEVRARLEHRVCTVVKASREDLDVSQRELAARLEWTRNVISNLETQRRVVTAVDLIVIAMALNLDPQRVLHRVLYW
jgi:predicted transcriptional regulator